MFRLQRWKGIISVPFTVLCALLTQPRPELVQPGKFRETINRTARLPPFGPITVEDDGRGIPVG